MISFVLGNALSLPLADNSIHCVITSPPYWGLRDYGVSGQLGLEPTPDCLGWATGQPCGECYVCHMVQVFREVRRVLRDDGTLWLNLGDSYASAGRTNYGFDPKLPQRSGSHRNRTTAINGLKPKDIIGIPWRVAFALQADGWYLRQDIIWQKPNPMPESVSDRCTKAHEYVFLLTKSQRYYFDAEAIKEPAEGGAKGSRFHTGKTALHQLGRSSTEDREDSTTRNHRSVWPVATQPCKEAHFATFPRKLIEPMVLAGTSEQGCCPDCGKPWRRVLEKGFSAHDGQTGTIYPEGSTASRLALLRQAARARGEEYTSDKKTLRWDAACSCGKESTPCTVLDPFSGAGTTGLVCQQHGRNYVGIELNPAYIGIARKRLNAQKAQPLKKSKRQQAQDGGLFSEVA